MGEQQASGKESSGGEANAFFRYLLLGVTLILTIQILKQCGGGRLR